MKRSHLIKLSFILVVLFTVISITYFKINFTDFFSTNSTNSGKNITLDELKAQTTENTDLDESNSSGYFSVFKFINSFAPSK